MKIIIMAFISFTWLSANDIQRVDDIINDIQNLKKNSQILIDTTNEYEKIFKQKIAMLEAKVEKQSLELKEKPKVLVKTITVTKTKDDNPFPKLQMKPKYFKAGTFRLSEDSDIYDAQDGKVIDSWEKGTSFTSNKQTDDMIKITGYFVEKSWKKSEKTMWIKSENTFER